MDWILTSLLSHYHPQLRISRRTPFLMYDNRVHWGIGRWKESVKQSGSHHERMRPKLSNSFVWLNFTGTTNTQKTNQITIEMESIP